METNLNIKYFDNPDDGCISFEDVLEIPIDSPENLFIAVFGKTNVGIPHDDIEAGLNPEGKAYIQINLRAGLEQTYYENTALELYNKILYFFEKRYKELSSSSRTIVGHKITDDEFHAMDNGEMINDGTNPPDNDISGLDDE